MFLCQTRQLDILKTKKAFQDAQTHKTEADGRIIVSEFRTIFADVCPFFG